MSSITARRPYLPPVEDLPEGSFVRGAYVFRDWISDDGSTGYAAEAGRYHLYISWACPWAQRAAIVRDLLGLQDAIGLTVVDPIRDERGWRFTIERDPVNGFEYLEEAYLATDPGFVGRPTVPVLWDTVEGRIVSNNFHDITIMLETECDALTSSDLDLYPLDLRDEIDEVNEVVYCDVNNGVYKCGFARTQAAYERAFDALFDRLDALEDRLSAQRYLVRGQLTEADVRLFPTLVRFDAVYHVHFKCNRKRLVDYPQLWAYTRDLFAIPAFAATTNLDHCKRHYFMTHPNLNPTRIVPKGPELDWHEPHDRERLT